VDNDNGFKFECNDEKVSLGTGHGKRADEEDQIFDNKHPGEDHQAFPQFIFAFV